MSAAAMYAILYGTMPDELFLFLISIPLCFITMIAQDVALSWYRSRND